MKRITNFAEIFKLEKNNDESSWYTKSFMDLNEMDNMSDIRFHKTGLLICALTHKKDLTRLLNSHILVPISCRRIRAIS